VCGLVGIVSRSARHNARFLHGMYNNQSRGTDAYGVVGMTPAGAVSIYKKAGAVYNSIHKCRFINTSPVLMGHTRFSTHGSASVMINNHPFSVGNIVGMHNGVISNYQSIAQDRKYKLQSQCDSEVLFHMLNDMESDADIQDIIDEVSGYFVITWVDRRAPHLINILRGGSSTQLSMAEVTGVGFIYSSDKEHMPYYSTDKARVINVPQYTLVVIDSHKMKMTMKEFALPPVGKGYTGKNWYDYSDTDYDDYYGATTVKTDKTATATNAEFDVEAFEDATGINCYYDCNLRCWADILTGVPIATELVPNGGLYTKPAKIKVQL
jgi:glucosamine 6-phosphate synthetase-like amidotransferase/phosphosugar isomerase protein